MKRIICALLLASIPSVAHAGDFIGGDKFQDPKSLAGEVIVFEYKPSTSSEPIVFEYKPAPNGEPIVFEYTPSLDASSPRDKFGKIEFEYEEVGDTIVDAYATEGGETVKLKTLKNGLLGLEIDGKEVMQLQVVCQHCK